MAKPNTSYPALCLRGQVPVSAVMLKSGIDSDFEGAHFIFFILPSNCSADELAKAVDEYRVGYLPPPNIMLRLVSGVEVLFPVLKNWDADSIAERINDMHEAVDFTRKQGGFY